ncbi:MAG TPA: hypothetical protein VGG39_30890 [Polyangiaceae bacterium]
MILTAALALGIGTSILTVERPAAAAPDDLSASYSGSDPIIIEFSGCGFSSLEDVDVYYSTVSATDCETKDHHIGTYEAFLGCCGGCSGAFSGNYDIGCPDSEDITYWVCAYNDHTGVWSNVVDLGPASECTG